MGQVQDDLDISFLMSLIRHLGMIVLVFFLWQTVDLIPMGVNFSSLMWLHHGWMIGTLSLVVYMMSLTKLSSIRLDKEISFSQFKYLLITSMVTK